MAFPCLTVFMIFILWLTYRISRAKKGQAAKEEAFWDKESKANTTPKKDIDNLSYITIPIDKFPINFSQDGEILDIEKQLIELSEKRILNLTGITNTELKLTYGLPNFDTMSEIGENFDKLTLLLNAYAKKLLENNMVDDATRVLEFAVGIGTDISESYITLSSIYTQNSKDAKQEFLIEQVKNSNLLLKQSILDKIDSTQ